MFGVLRHQVKRRIFLGGKKNETNGIAGKIARVFLRCGIFSTV